MHPRLTATNGAVAHVSLRGKVNASCYVEGVLQQITPPMTDLLRQPNGKIDCQLLKGTGFLTLETNSETGFSFGQSLRDGYVGYVNTRSLQDPATLTHRVTALATHIYCEPHLKARSVDYLPFGAEVTVISEGCDFFALSETTYIPAQHLSPLNEYAPDFVTVMESFTGIPYLWGGNTTWGMDCSGAIWLALRAAGYICPRDADMQENTLGAALESASDLQRGDLVFWKGHVGVMADNRLLVHANAHSMTVISEPLAAAIARIKAGGGGTVTSYRRLQSPPVA